MRKAALLLSLGRAMREPEGSGRAASQASVRRWPSGMLLRIVLSEPQKTSPRCSGSFSCTHPPDAGPQSPWSGTATSPQATD